MLAHDATTNSTSATGDLSWLHTPVAAVVKGVIVRIAQNTNATDQIDGVTYGGVPMVECPGSPLLHSNGAEDGALFAYFLAEPPPGPQQVVVDTNSTGSTRRAVCSTVTADAGKSVRVEDSAVLDSAGVANPSVTVPTGASTPTMAFAVLHSGQDAVTSITAAAGNTEQFEHDFGSQCASWIRSSSLDAGGGVSIGWTVASEEAGVLAVALREETVSYPVAEEFVGGTPGNGTNITVNAPTRNVGDDLFAGLYIYDLAMAVPTPAGWTLLADTTSTDTHRIRLYHRVADGTSADNFAPSWADSPFRNAAILRVVNGAGTATHISAVGDDGVGDSTTATIPGVTTTDANTMLLAYVNTDTESTITEPAGLIDHGSTAGVSFFSGTQAAPGPSGNKVFSVTPSQPWTGHLLALSPQPEASGVDAVEFNGSGDRIANAIGACDVTGAVTIAAIVRADTALQRSVLNIEGDPAIDAYGMYLDGTGELHLWNGTNDTEASQDVPLNAWALLVGTKAAGTTTPRLHIYNFDTDAWDRANAAGTLPNAPSVGAGRVRIGSFHASSEFWDGEIAVVGVWATQLSDSQVDELIANLRTQDWLDCSAGAPVGLWDAGSDALGTDLTGNGADEVSRTGTTPTDDGPDGWLYGVAPPANRKMAMVI